MNGEPDDLGGGGRVVAHRSTIIGQVLQQANSLNELKSEWFLPESWKLYSRIFSPVLGSHSLTFFCPTTAINREKELIET